MAFSGSGVFNRLYSFVSDRNASIKIRADRMDAELDGMATGLSTCITKDGQTTITQDIPFNNKKITGLGDATGAADAINRQTGDARYLANVGFTATVAASALTIKLTNAAGLAPTATAPVIIPFRSATAATGTTLNREVASSLSLVISSGSTLGTTSAVAFYLHIVAFDDAGTVRLGVINPLGAELSSSGIGSATSEGGSGTADTAQIYYAGTAITSKAYRMIGRLTWNSGLATAGTWDAAPDVIEAYSPDFLLDGNLGAATALSISTSGTLNGTSTQISARNLSNGASALNRLALGNDSDAADCSIELNGSGNSGGVGARSVTLRANGGPMQLVCSGILYSPNVFSQTTGTGANVAVDSGGQIRRSTSSLRYKTNVRDYDRGLDAVLALRPVFYESKNGEGGTFAGLIAEEVHAAGLTEFVVYDSDGAPDALHYPNMVALLVKALQDASAKIDALTARIEALEA